MEFIDVDSSIVTRGALRSIHVNNLIVDGTITPSIYGPQGPQGFQGESGINCGQVLYFNYSVTGSVSTYYQISPEPNEATSSTGSLLLTNGINTDINHSPYITDVNFPAQTRLNDGDWNFGIYANVSAYTPGDTTYISAVLSYYRSGVVTQIATSENSINVTSTTPTLYRFLMSVPGTDLDISDRLVVNLNVTHTGSTCLLKTYYEGASLNSFVNTTLPVYGATGPQGTIGPQGPQGNQGFQGTQGTTGPQGLQGVSGPQGFQGTQGVTGSQGPQGFQGVSGPQGFQGPAGSSGAATFISLSGTANQVIVSSPTGNITLSLPQSISTGSTVIFNKLGLQTTNPLTSLQVSGTGTVDQGLIHVRSDSGYPQYITFTESGIRDNGGIGFDNGSGTMKFKVGNFLSSATTAMSIQSNGSVGVGTTGPTALLDVSGFVRSTNTNGTPSTGVGVETLYNTSLDSGYVQSYSRTSSVYKPLRVEGSNVTLNVNSVGNVGIGDSAPTSKLTIQSTGSSQDPMVYLKQTNDYGYLQVLDANSSGKLSTVGVNNGVRTDTIMCLDRTTKYVGIGTTGAAAPLHVSSTTSGGGIQILEDRSGGAANLEMQFRSQYSGLSNPSKIAASIVGAPANNGGRLVFNTAQNAVGGTLTERMRIDDAGLVGINYTAPASNLDIRSTFGQYSNQTVSVGFGNQTYQTALVSGKETTASTGATYRGDLTFSTNLNNVLNERARITADGYLGIGTNAPEDILHVSKSTSAGVGGKLILDNPAAAATNNACEISFLTDSGSSVSSYNANIKAIEDGSGFGYTALTFGTFGGAGVPDERMRITPAGNVGISSTAPAAKLQVATNSAAEAGNYGKCIQTVRQAASAVHKAFVREGNYVWGLGYIYNTNNFGIFNGPSATDSSNTSAALSIDTSSNVAMTNNLSVSGTGSIQGYAVIPKSVAGEIYLSSNTTQALTISGNKLTVFDSVGISNFTTPSSSSDQITITIAGTYRCTARTALIFASLTASVGVFSLVIQKNGSSVSSSVSFISHDNTTTAPIAVCDCIVDCAVNDVITLFAGINPAQTPTLNNTYLGVFRVGSY